MKYTDDSAVVIEHASEAFDLATQDVLNEARVNMAGHSRTGTWSADLRVAKQNDSTGNLSALVGSTLARGPAVEFGANVGARRGPHAKGIYAAARALDHFGTYYQQRLAQTPFKRT